MKQFNKLVVPYIIWMSIMIVVPMLMIVLYAFTAKGNSVLTLKFTLENFARFFSDSIFPSVLFRSLWWRLHLDQTKTLFRHGVRERKRGFPAHRVCFLPSVCFSDTAGEPDGKDGK